VSAERPRGSAVDATALMARLEGDRELLAELVELFVAEGQALIQTIDNAVAASDPEAVHRAAHTLKGAVANFCAPAAVSAALALETAGRTREMADAPHLLARLRAEIDAVTTALADAALTWTPGSDADSDADSDAGDSDV